MRIRAHNVARNPIQIILLDNQLLQISALLHTCLWRPFTNIVLAKVDRYWTLLSYLPERELFHLVASELKPVFFRVNVDSIC